MRYFTATALLAALLQVVLAQDLKINTLANPVECQPVQFTWQGGVAPYYLSLIPAGQPAAPALKQFPVIQSGQSLTWVVDMPSGSTFSTMMRDSTGTQAFSDIQTVQAGPDNSCLKVAASLSGTSASMSPATPTSPTAGIVAQKAISTPGSSATTSVASATTTSTSTTGTASKTTGTTTSATATSSNAASGHASAGAIGIAGLLGLAGAALLG